MTLPRNVAELQGENVLFELECIDRMYLNLYVPQLASAPEVAAYFRGYKGHRFASTKEAVAMSEGFRRQVFDFAERTHSKRRGAPKVFRCLDRELDGPFFADSARWRRL